MDFRAVQQLEIRKLCYVVALADELHFGRAAERIGIGQPPLSKAIKAFEKALGTPIFKRTTRGTQLTSAGQVFVADARRIVALAEQAKRGLIEFAAGRTGRITIGVGEGSLNPRLSILLTQYRAAYPQVDVRMLELPFTRQLQELESGLLDLAFALVAPDEPYLCAEPLWREPLAIIAPATHPMASKNPLTLADCAQDAFILCRAQTANGAQGQLEALIRLAHPQPNIVNYDASFEMLLLLVTGGYGIGLISAAQSALIRQPNVIARPLMDRDLALTTFLIHRREGASPLVTQFIERAKSIR